MFVLNIRRPRAASTEANGFVVTALTREELRDTLQRLAIYNDDELELAVQLARDTETL